MNHAAYVFYLRELIIDLFILVNGTWGWGVASSFSLYIKYNDNKDNSILL